MTLNNSAIVGYPSSTITDGSTICTVDVCKFQTGKSITVQMASDMTMPVGTLTSGDLFTSVSSTLAAGRTLESVGAMMAECGDIPKITDVTYFDNIT